MGWFSRKPTQEKQALAAIKVATNLYLLTIPGGTDAPAPLEFTLPDSRFRYLMFCLSATTTACGKEMANPDAVVNQCLHGLVTLATTELKQDYFDGPINVQDVANSGAAYLQEFLNNWSAYIELEKAGEKTVDLVCTMIHNTESAVPAGKADIQRLWPLALMLHMQFPTMRSAFKELANR